MTPVTGVAAVVSVVTVDALVRPDQVTLGVLVDSVPRDAVDDAVAACGVRDGARRPYLMRVAFTDETTTTTTTTTTIESFAPI